MLYAAYSPHSASLSLSLSAPSRAPIQDFPLPPSTFPLPPSFYMHRGRTGGEPWLHGTMGILEKLVLHIMLFIPKTKKLSLETHEIISRLMQTSQFLSCRIISCQKKFCRCSLRKKERDPKDFQDQEGPKGTCQCAPLPLSCVGTHTRCFRLLRQCSLERRARVLARQPGRPTDSRERDGTALKAARSLSNKVARWQNLIPSFPWIALVWRA